MKSEKTYSQEAATKESVSYFDGDTLAASVFIGKYALRNAQHELIESTPDQAHQRLAKEFARIEKKYPNPVSEEDIYSYFKNFKYIVPQGSPMSAIGNPYQIQSASNCFVIPSPLDSYGGILLTDQEQAQIMKRRGGVGFDISNIRPKGIPTKNAARTTDGIGVFMERFSNTCREVAQNGRRGALMLTISCHHPEIRTFINIKRDKKKVTGANISIRMTDEFMKAVKGNKKVELRFPVDSKTPTISEEVNAREIWNDIVDAAWESAEPGILFWDNVLENGPADIYPEYRSTSTNPCFAGDQRLLTDVGYIKFKSLAENFPIQKIHTDNRISFVGTNKNEKWEIDINKQGTTSRDALVSLTQKNAKVFLLKFDNGMSVKCTEDHDFATVNGMIKAKSLTKEDKILVSTTNNNGSVVDKEPETDDEISAFIMGIVCGDGTYLQRKNNNDRICIDIWGSDRKRITPLIIKYIKTLYDNNSSSISHLVKSENWKNRKLSPSYIVEDDELDKTRIVSTFLTLYLNNKFGFGKKSKHTVPEFILENASNNIGKYYLAGLYYADACPQGNVVSGFTVRLAQSNEGLLKDVQLLCHANGIQTKIYLRREAHEKYIKGKIYNIKKQYELITVNGSIKEYALRIGFFGHIEKQKKLDDFYGLCMKRRKKSNQYYAKMISYEFIGNEDVYCLKEDITRSCIVQGLSARRCGEITLSPYDSCRLMVVNLNSFVNNPYTPEAEFDFIKFAQITQVAQRLMDDMIDIELEQIDKILKKIKDDEEPENVKKIELDLWNNVKRICINGRRTGLGITALGDALAALNIRYGSKESISKTEKIYKALAINSEKSSCILAKERGAFPIFDAKMEKGHPFIERLMDADEELSALYKKHGRRNISTTTTAPVGSVSTMTQTTSGIEPSFLLKYTRRKKINPNDKDAKADFVDEMGDKWQEFTVYHHGFKKWMDVTGKTKIEDSPYHKATSNDIDWGASVDLQAAAQKWISHSISKTCNLPNSATKELVSEIYMQAWESGCKGFTIYRDGCRTGVLIEEVQKETKKTGRDAIAITKTIAPKRPESLKCELHHIKLTKRLDKIRSIEYCAVVGMFAGGEPYELFVFENGSIDKKYVHGNLVKKSKGNYDVEFEDGFTIKNIMKDQTEEEELVTRLVSTSLRHGTPIEFLVHQLEKVRTDNIASFTKVMCRVLKKYIKDGVRVSGETCPQCGGKDIIRMEGCQTCKSCGYSKC